ncbi:MAG: amidohydrolase family protein [bacterium]|nr:amidohydrolase family protein [bacterium]
MRTRAVTFFVCLALAASPSAQGEPHNGPRPIAPTWFALTGATVVPSPGERQENTTIVIKDGAITALGGAAPAGATRVDCSGLMIYPGLIDPFVTVDSPAIEPDRSDAHWSPMIQPQRQTLAGAGIPESDRKALRELGFAAAAAVPAGGIVAGTATVVLLDEPATTERPRVIREHAGLVARLARNRNGYPNSEQGAIALLRQTLFDGAWYERCLETIRRNPALANSAPPVSAALAAMARHHELPLLFETRNELQALRAARIAKEHERTAVLIGSGMEFRRLAAIAATGCSLILPLEFPEAPDLDSAAATAGVSLRQLQSWEQAPTNSARLLKAGVEFAWTTARLEKRSAFRSRMRDAIRCGVDEKTALAALTTIPARLLDVDGQLGTIAVGKLANLTVVAGELFDPKAEIRAVWVHGKKHDVDPATDAHLDGEWRLTTWPGSADSEVPVLAIDGKRAKFAIGEDKVAAAVGGRDRQSIALRVMDAFGKGSGVTWLRGHRRGDELAGTGTKADGSSFRFRGERAPASSDGDENDQPPAADAFEPPALTALPTPLGGYGTATMPEPESFAIVGATLWPSDGRGVIVNGGIIVSAGKITYAGPAADMPALPENTRKIDGQGKHVTPGLIDCHSHTGIQGGINESGQAVTAEARIQDVINPDDVNWYRQLAGGVTAANQLHGSANAIGGQSSTVKLRFGCAHPDDMRFEGAPAGIKWALGENPRRANGSRVQTRYPSTRMGVEALIRDRLVAAEAYRKEHAGYEALAPRDRARTLPPRRDLELEAVGEIIAGQRRIHCHSYRQDEIFMLCGIAAEYGFKIGTFQHVLEGYKVADAIKEHAIGASSFSDWWAYKFEVFDAIPDNGAIMHELGVSVSFNSDSNEHARRLNTEAGKAVKYGGVAPAEALCFVTKNPAVQLGIFDRTGSLSSGKDADVAMWSANPLSYMARCEATWVDGRPLFSLDRDAELRAGIANERSRLIQKAAAASKGRRPDKAGDKESRFARLRDAYWAAEYLDDAYCCRTHTLQGGR